MTSGNVALVASLNEKLLRVRFVLIGTTHPGNIGAVARAMKNMRLTQLYLVRPKHYPNAEATARASGADDLLERAQLFDDLDSALRGCRLVVGSSARLRSVGWPQLAPDEFATRAVSETAAGGEVALLFGRESSGLSNQELDRCHYLVHIPANPEYSSLNIAQAAQVLAYELHCAALRLDGGTPPDTRDVVPVELMEGFFRHLEQTMEVIGFSDPKQSQRLQRRLRRLFFRARPDQEEMNILRGILNAAQGKKSTRSR